MKRDVLKSRRPIAVQVRSYVQSHPMVRECLRLGIVNNRALAREIMGAKGRQNLEACAMALGRLAARLKRSSASMPRADAVLKAASIVIRTQMSVATLRGDLPVEALTRLKQLLPPRTPVAFVQAENHSIVLAPEQHQNLLTKVWRLAPSSVRTGLAQLSFVFSAKAVDTRGVIAQLTALLAAHEINLIEIIGVSGELLVLIPEEELSAALEALKHAGIGRMMA
jgi:hypothetical protein